MRAIWMISDIHRASILGWSVLGRGYYMSFNSLITIPVRSQAIRRCLQFIVACGVETFSERLLVLTGVLLRGPGHQAVG